MDYTKLLNKITPKPDGEPPIHLRVMTVDAVNADGTLDLTTPGYTLPDGVTVAPVIIPGVARLSSAYVTAGDVVQILAHRGSLLVLGPAGGLAPGERIATTVYDTDSSNFTTSETEIASVTASLVSGRTYRVRLAARIGTSVANDTAVVRIREDNTSGTEMTVDFLALPNAGTAGNPHISEAEYTAVSTGSKTFVGTAVRGSGTGNLRREAASTRQTYIYVDYIRG